MPTNWAELKYGKRLCRLAADARERVRQKHPENDAEFVAQQRKTYIYKVLSDSSYNKLAFWIGAFIGLCILLSTVTFILETMPAYARSDTWRNVFFGAEIFFVTVFTTEICVRLWAYPEAKLNFFKDPMNIVDVVSILPFFIELALVYTIGSSEKMIDLRIVRALRLMRMLKMGRFSTDLQLLAEGMVRSKGAFLLLCCTMVVGCVFFSAVMWTIERGEWEPGQQCFARPPTEPFMNGCSPFESVPVAFWWSITTMTTVGYGDTFPVTPLGRVVAGVAMLAGIFCVALPTGILCTEFAKLYDEQNHIVRYPDVDDISMRLRPKEELELFVSSEALGSLRNEIDEHMEYMYCLCSLYNQSHTGKDKKALDTIKDSFQLYRTFSAQAVCGIDSMKEVLHSVTEELKQPQIPFGHRGRSPNPSPRFP